MPTPTIVTDALHRHDQGTDSVLTRELFASAITHLATTPRTPETADERAASARVFGLPKGPDWAKVNTLEFFTGYLWHLLFAHCREALALVPKVSSPSEFGYHHHLPIYWRPMLAEITPADFEMILAWGDAFKHDAAFEALFVEKLGQPGWDAIWQAWCERRPRLGFNLPPTLIDHPALHADPAGTLDTLRDLMPHAYATLDAAPGTPHTLDSHLLAVLLGKQWGNATPLAARPDHFWRLHNGTGTEWAILMDAQSPAGLAALRAAFPTPEAFVRATPLERAAAIRARVFGVFAPSDKPTKAPVKTKDVTELLAGQGVRYEGLRNIASYQQRCREALATGRLSPKDTQAVQATLDLLAQQGATAPIHIPKSLKDNTQRHLPQCRKAITAAVAAIAELGGTGHVDLAKNALAALENAVGEYNVSLRISTQDALKAVLIHPTLEGLAWVRAQGVITGEWFARLMNVPNAPAGWHEQVLALADQDPLRWVDRERDRDDHPGFLAQGGPWLFTNPAHRVAWFAREVAKPRAGWELSPQAMAQITQSYGIYNCRFQDWDLLGVLRFAIAAQEDDRAWFEALAQAGEAEKGGQFPLARRWARASAHKRIALRTALCDPQALLALDHQDVRARIDAILGRA